MSPRISSLSCKTSDQPGMFRLKGRTRATGFATLGDDDAFRVEAVKQPKALRLGIRCADSSHDGLNGQTI